VSQITALKYHQNSHKTKGVSKHKLSQYINYHKQSVPPWGNTSDDKVSQGLSTQNVHKCKLSQIQNVTIQL